MAVSLRSLEHGGNRNRLASQRFIGCLTPRALTMRLDRSGLFP
jgi:hypothetical protein